MYFFYLLPKKRLAFPRAPSLFATPLAQPWLHVSTSKNDYLL